MVRGRFFLATCCALLLSAGAVGAQDYKESGFYLGYAATKSTASKKNIAGGIKSSDIIGSGSLVHNIRFGRHKTPTNNNIGGKAFINLYLDSSLNNEYGISTGIEFEKKILSNQPLSAVLGFEAGYGIQSVKNDKKQTSRGEVTLTKAIPTGHLAINAGLAYRLSESFSADLSYVFRINSYTAQYENSFFWAKSKWNEQNHGVRLGLNYHF